MTLLLLLATSADVAHTACVELANDAADEATDEVAAADCDGADSAAAAQHNTAHDVDHNAAEV